MPVAAQPHVSRARRATYPLESDDGDRSARAFGEDRPAAPRIHRMMIAVIWHYWIAVALVLFTVIPVVAMTAIGYLNKVVRPKYPPRQRSRM
jgi:hypothetical protein